MICEMTIWKFIPCLLLMLAFSSKVSPKKYFLPQCLEIEIKQGLENSFRPTPGFFEPREPPKQLSYHHGKIIVSNIHPSLHRLFISFELFSFHQDDNFFAVKFAQISLKG